MESADASESFIESGEKFALLAIEAWLVDPPVSPIKVANDVWITGKPPLTLKAHWREWLGSVRHDHLLTSTLFVIIKIHSKTPTIFDDESRRLLMLGDRFLTSLALAARLRLETDPLLMTGGCDDSGFDLKQVLTLHSHPILPGHRPPRLNLDHVREAGRLYQSIGRMVLKDEFLRLHRILSTFKSALRETEALDQLHQFCRCIEGLIIPGPGQSTKKIQSRTQLFIGPKHQSLMLSMYKNRSAVEHLNDHLLVINSGSSERIDIIRQAIIAEYIVRTCLLKIHSTPDLWPYFGTDDALKLFWSLTEAERNSAWGPPIDPLAVLKEFKPDSIQNWQLGLQQ